MIIFNILSGLALLVWCAILLFVLWVGTLTMFYYRKFQMFCYRRVPHYLWEMGGQFTALLLTW